MSRPVPKARSPRRAILAVSALAGSLMLALPAQAQSVDPLELALEQRPFYIELTDLALSGDDAALAARVEALTQSQSYEELYGLGRFLANKPTEYVLPHPDFAGAIAAFGRAQAIAEVTPGRDARRLALRAKYEIARMIMRSAFDDESRARARTLLGEAAGQGLGQAALVLGRAYVSGELGEVDEAKSEEWYRRALSLGVGSAAIELSSILATADRPDARDEALNLSRVGLALLQREALEGDTDSAIMLGQTYINHPLIPSNPIEAQRWLSFGAGRGDAQGLRALSELLRNGTIGTPDPDLAGDHLDRGREPGLDPGGAGSGAQPAAPGTPEHHCRRGRIPPVAGPGDRGGEPAAIYIAAKLAAQDGDFDRQRQLLDDAARLGSIDAMFELVQVHLTRGETDAVLALVETMERLVSQRVSAMTALAELKLSGDAQSVLRDVDGGLELMQRAADLGSGRAMFQLALLYRDGVLVERDEEKAASLTAASAAARHLPAVLELADQNARGLIEGASMERAMALLDQARAIALEEGSTGMMSLGRGFLSGIGALDMRAEGVEWLERSIALGNPRAMVSLADALQNGAAGTFDPERAMTLYKEAIDYGDLTAHYQIGVAYATGLATKIDFDAAMDHYRLAAAAGSADAAAELGLAYATGAFVEQDPQQAFDWLRRAADAGNVPAMIYIANLIAMDVLPGFSKDDAIDWLTRAAETGDIDAQFQLALTLDRGLVGERDVDGARYWMGVAARAGHFQAQMELERLLERLNDESG
ncbi:MAG: hypothetical protein R3F55_11005 [Alphaproteobacteria bacterium]